MTTRCSAPVLPALTLSVLACATAYAGPGQWSIVATYPVPEGASGLAWDGTWLYTGIYGPDGGRVYRIDPSDGSYTLLFTGSHEDAFGLTWDGSHLWTTDHPGSSSTPAVALKMDMSGTVIDQISLPDHYMSGIAYDDGDFWVARYYQDPSHLYKLDSAGTVLRDFTAPDNQPWDLCVENGNLWMADYWGDTLYKINPSNGALLDSHPSEGVDPAGIVYDGQFLWYCDNGEGGVDFLYKVDLQGGGTPEIAVSASSHEYGMISIGQSVTWNVTVFNTGSADLEISGVTFDDADLSTMALFPLTVPASSNAQLPIVYAPSGFGALDATATINSNDPVHGAEAIALTGHGLFPDPTLDVLLASHDYGQVRLNAHTRWFMDVANHGNQVLNITSLPIGDPRYYLDSGTVLPLSLDPLETAQVGVWFNPIAAVAYPASLDVISNDAASPTAVSLTGTGLDTVYPMGTTLWSFTIDASFDNSPKAMTTIPDVSGDGVPDIIICSEDDFVRCFNGNASGNGDVLWEHEIPGGSVYQQTALQIMEDIDEDGLHDVVVGAAWAGKLIRAISGGNGDEIWTHDTDNYGDGGWVYAVDCGRDYNGDGSVDVLAATGDDAADMGPKRVYCLNGLTGIPIWERPLGGPVFGVISADDFTGDGVPDVVAGASNAEETQGAAYGISGSNGALDWTFNAGGSSVWALAQIGDITSDGINDIAVADFFGNFYALDALAGGAQYAMLDSLGTTTRLERLDDVNGDGQPEIVPAHFSTFARAIDSVDGTPAWTTALVDKPAVVSRIPDVSGDGINDVVLGTLFSNNRGYFLDGTDGAVMHSFDYGTPVDSVTAIPDIAGDGSWEMVLGGRNGLVTVYSGGLAVPGNPADVNGDGNVDFADILLVIGAWGPNPGNPADVNGDGVVDFADILLVIAGWTG